MQDKNFQGFERPLVDNLELVRVEQDGTVVFSLFVGSEYHHVGGQLPTLLAKLLHLARCFLLYECSTDSARISGSLHGGAASLILGMASPFHWQRGAGLANFSDQCTSLAISPYSAPGYWE